MHPTLAHIDRELERLDLLLYREVLRLRARYQLSLDEFRGLYVSDAQVDALLHTTSSIDAADVSQQAGQLAERNQAQLDPACAWATLTASFALTHFEQDVLLLALAPELDLKYETIFGYLNNDVARKWPTRDLALRLYSSPETRLADWDFLTPTAILFRSALLLPGPAAADRASALAAGFSPSPALARHLFSPGHNPAPEPPLTRLDSAARWDDLHTAPAARERLRAFAANGNAGSCPPLIVLEGGAGSGRRVTAQLLAQALSRPLFSLDAAAFLLNPAAAPSIVLQLRLAGGALLIGNAAAFFGTEGRPAGDAGRLLDTLEAAQTPVILACLPQTPWRELVKGRRHVAFTLDPPEPALRRELWRRETAARALSPDEATLDALTHLFRFTPGQITAAVQQAADLPDAATRESLFSAARALSSHRLGKLAVKVPCDFDWPDLVLPAATMRSVLEATSAIENRHKVMVEWGMCPGATTSLNILFSGASGTGKTMTAGIIARRLGLELYRCDLSGVVSKYIGETEKNLDRIFEAARESNAILFFDEADALFGKRSEVKDAHDRYANIEVSYLLQKLETHDGVVILASNLSGNIDDAFVRRLQYVVEFPAPNDVLRERLWRGMLHARAPVAADIDFSFLARQFSFTGGEIRKVTVDAAFLAAADGQRINMRLVVKAVGCHLVKSGRVPSAVEFKEYFRLLSEDV